MPITDAFYIVWKWIQTALSEGTWELGAEAKEQGFPYKAVEQHSTKLLLKNAFDGWLKINKYALMLVAETILLLYFLFWGEL